MKSVFLAIVSLFIITILGCVNLTPVAGNGSDVGNGMVTGVLYQPDGKTFAKGATVYLRKKDLLADTTLSAVAKRLAATADTVLTDNNGKYIIDSIDTGIYVIEGISGSNMALIDSVMVNDPDSTVDMGADTLRPAGSVKGIISLTEGGDPRKVFVLAFGIDRFAIVMSDGSFHFDSLAQGTYNLRFISSLGDYGVLDMERVTVESRDTTNLGTILLPFTGVPTPKELTLSYDTLRQVVMLSWSSADTALVKGYNIYRRNVDSNTVFLQINTNQVKDTTYTDFTCVQDQIYQYRVAAVDGNVTEGTKSDSVEARIVSAFELQKAIPLTGNDPFRFTISNDSLLFVVFRADAIVKVYNKNGDSIYAFGQGQLSQPYGIALDSKENVFVADLGGNITKFAKDGTRLSDWLIDSPTDIVIDQNDEIYVLNANSQRITKLDSLGIKQDSVILDNQVSQLILDTQGNIHIVDPVLFSVITYDSNLVQQNTLLNIPSNMLKAVDAKGNYYFQKYETVGQSSVDFVHIVSQSGETIATWGAFVSLTQVRISGSAVYLLNYNEDPWYPQIQVFKANF